MMPPHFDPSKLDPKLLMEISQVMGELPPHQLSRMQTLMHNMMAGFDVRNEMEEFEKSLPPGFREKLMNLMVSQAAQSPDPALSPEGDMQLSDARRTILAAVAAGTMSPHDAEKLLFPSP